MVLETEMKLCVTVRFCGKRFFDPKIGKMDHEWAKNKILVIIFYHENLYYLLCSCTNPIFEKMFVPEIWAKMFSASQIAGQISRTSPEQISKIALSFARCYKST